MLSPLCPQSGKRAWKICGFPGTVQHVTMVKMYKRASESRWRRELLCTELLISASDDNVVRAWHLSVSDGRHWYVAPFRDAHMFLCCYHPRIIRQSGSRLWSQHNVKARLGFRTVDGCPYVVCLDSNEVVVLHLEV
jgi:hypothetical protein